MLRLVSRLKGYAIEASDGKFGRISDLLFDDGSWKVKWLVVDTGSWLTGRKVLIHPSAVQTVDDDQVSILVSLTKAQIKGSPDILQDQPVSRQMERDHYGYYGWDPYWGGSFYGMGAIAAPFSSRPYFGGYGMGEDAALQHNDDDEDPHLRSFEAIEGYHIHATDGSIGHVEDLLVDDTAWGVRYLIIDTRNWWPGQHVLVSPFAVRTVNWAERKISVDLSRELIKGSPPWQPVDVVDQDYERRLHSHYSWPGYGW